MGGRGAVSATSAMGVTGSASSFASYQVDALSEPERLTREDLSPEELSSADTYIEDEFLPEFESRFGHGIGPVGLVRAAQQGKDLGNPEDNKKYQVMGLNIENVISRGETETGTIYRGVRLSKSDFSKYKEGVVFDQRGTSSWSSSDGKALEYALRSDVAGDVNVMFRVVSGGRAADVGGISKLHEGEWWMSKDRSMRAIKDPYSVSVWGNKVWIVDVEVL